MTIPLIPTPRLVFLLNLPITHLLKPPGYLGPKSTKPIRNSRKKKK